MATFPTLYRRGTEIHNPIVGVFDDTMAHDPVVKSTSEGGYVKTRARFTRITRKWTIKYDWLTKVNKNTLKAFEGGNANTIPVGVAGGSDYFTWTNPENSTAYTVRFLEPFTKYTPHSDTNFLWWMAEFILEEV